MHLVIFTDFLKRMRDSGVTSGFGYRFMRKNNFFQGPRVILDIREDWFSSSLPDGQVTKFLFSAERLFSDKNFIHSIIPADPRVNRKSLLPIVVLGSVYER